MVASLFASQEAARPFNPLTSYGATAAVSKAVNDNAADVPIVFFSDSTGDASDEWIRTRATNFGTRYPTHSVTYRVWDGVSNYGAPVQVTTGTGPRTIVIYNCALSGSTLNNFMGGFFANAIGNLSPKAVIISMGQNYIGVTDLWTLRGQFVGAIEQIRRAQPAIPISMVLQNPRRDDTLMTPVNATISSIASDYGDIGLIDVNSLFLAAGKNPALYADNVHPNAAGQVLYTQAADAKFNNAPPVAFSAVPAWSLAAGTNLLTNGTLQTWPGAAPTGWLFGGNGVLTKDTSILYPGSPTSAKMVNGASVITSLSQTISAVPYRGLRVTAWALVYIEVAANLNAGRFRIFDNGTGAPLVAQNPGAVGLGGWRFLCISGWTVSADATLLGLFLYPHSTAGSAGTIYVDRAGLFVGDYPRAIV